MAAQVSFGPRFHPRTAPVTFWFIVGSAAVSIALFFLGATGAGPLLRLLVCRPTSALAEPWTVLTYPFVNPMNPFFFLLMGYVLWWAGADLERWWGSRVQAWGMVTVSLAVTLLLAAATALNPAAGEPTLVGAGPILAALLTVWGLRNPRATVILLIVPVSGTVIAVLAVAGVWFDYGPYHGLFAALGSSGLAALYLHRGNRFHRFVNRFIGTPEARAKKERDKRFQKLMKHSGLREVKDDERPHRPS